MVEQTKILKHDADPPPQRRQPSLLRVAISCSNSVIRPRVGRSDRNSMRSSEVLPAPDGPVRNWNECRRSGT